MKLIKENTLDKVFNYKNKNGIIISKVYIYKKPSNTKFKLDEYYEVYLVGNVNKQLLEEVVESYKDDILIYQHNYYNKCNVDFNLLEEVGLLQQNRKMDYRFIDDISSIYSNKGDCFILNNYLKNILYNQNINLNDIKYEKISENELINTIYNDNHMEYAMLYYTDFPNSFIGFRYFSIMCNDKHINNSYYIVAKYNDIILGVISLKQYEIMNNLEYFVNFIDVREDLKNKGIATGMIHYLSKLNSDNIISSDLSDEGELCGINKTFKRYLKEKWFDSDEEYYKKRSS